MAALSLSSGPNSSRNKGSVSTKFVAFVALVACLYVALVPTTSRDAMEETGSSDNSHDGEFAVIDAEKRIRESEHEMERLKETLKKQRADLNQAHKFPSATAVKGNKESVAGTASPTRSQEKIRGAKTPSYNDIASQDVAYLQRKNASWAAKKALHKHAMRSPHATIRVTLVLLPFV